MSNSPRSASSCLPTASTSTMPKATPGRSAPTPSAPWQSWVARLKEYVAVPAELLAETEKLAPYLAKSYDYAKGLKPKPTTREPRASS